MKFLNQKHESKFNELRIKMDEGYRNNKEYLTVVFILAANDELHSKVNPYFNTTDGMFSSEEMFQNEDFSTGLRTLAKLSVNLFNSNKSVDPIDLVADLDNESFELALATIRFRREGLSFYKARDGNMYLK